MDYEKKYKEAIERAKEKYATCYSPALLEFIFPELKKSNDKEIRKDIISNLERYIKCVKDGYDAPSAKDFVIKEIEKQITWLEKQGDKLQGRTALEAIREEKVDNQNCVKSVDDIKPKFKVGDWISNDMCDAHIAYIEDGMYYFDEGDGLSIVFVDEHYHLWTIEDAMDGDVLAFDDETIVIFKDLYNKTSFHSYCHIEDGVFNISKDDMPDWWEGEGFYPATRKQRDILFSKMKKAGYIFDFKNKEFKKIEIEIEIPFGAKDSELQEATYYIPKGFNAEIDDDKVVIKKGEKSTAWSKEDEHRVKDAIYFLDTAKKHYAITVELDACIDWLKSLKQRIGG